MLLLCCFSRCTGLVKIFEISNVAQSTAVVDLSAPTAFNFAPTNANNAGFIFCASLLIAHVFQAGHITQIAKPVVRPNAVDVINHDRPFAVDQSPDDAVCTVSATKKCGCAISSGINLCKSPLACITAIPNSAAVRRRLFSVGKHFHRTRLPCKCPCFWIVIQQVVQIYIRSPIRAKNEGGAAHDTRSQTGLPLSKRIVSASSASGVCGRILRKRVDADHPPRWYFIPQKRSMGYGVSVKNPSSHWPGAETCKTV